MESGYVRRLLLVIFSCLPVFLIAAAPAFTIVPTVIVYPLAASSDAIDRESIARIATTLAVEIAQGGAVKVLAPKPGVAREDYLSDARANHADYYVTGLLTPLGGGVSMIGQVVSTTSGSLVFSSSAQITTYSDVASQGDALREGILERASRGLAAFEAPAPPSDTPTPQAANGADVNVNKLFGRKKATPAAPDAIAPPADATIAILTFGGAADADQRNAAAQALAASIAHEGRHAVIVTAVAPSNDVCVANNAKVLLAGWLDTPTTAAGSTTASLRMIAYDCNGNIAFDHSFQNRESGPQATQLALSGVADAAAGAYISPPKGRK